MKTKAGILISILLCLNLITVNGQTKQDHKVLFEKARYTMDTKGDYKEAISLFESLIKNYPKEKDFAANSQLLIGMCYEKMGKADAAHAYQLVLDKYPGQKETVAMARQKLSELAIEKPAARPEGMAFRKIMDIPPGNSFNAVSPTGRYVILGDQSALTLMLTDLKTGKSWPVSEKGTMEGTPKSPDVCGFSPDEKQVGYLWWEGNMMDITELRIVNLDGSGMRKISHNELTRDTTTCPIPIKWSADGKFILGIAVAIENQMPSASRGHLGLLSLANGSFTRILTVTARPQIEIIGLFPDNKSIYFSRDQAEGIRNKDIYTMTIEGKKETNLVRHPSNDSWPFLSKDGKYIVFMSDRFGSNGLFVQEMSGIKPVGEPKLVKSNLEENITPYALTSEGSFFYMSSAFNMDIYSAPVNIGSEISIGSPEKMPVLIEGINIKPAWSPDGKYLAYLSLRENTYTQKMVFVIMDLSTGEERDLVTGLFPGLPMYWMSTHWSPDSRYLLVNGSENDYYQTDGFYKIDIKTGRHEMVMGESEPQDTKFGFFPQYTPNGKNLVYLKPDRKTIISYDIDKKKETTVFNAKHKIGYIALSHDGRYIAADQNLENKSETESLLMIQIADSQIITFNNPVKNGTLRWPEWTIDNKGVILSAYNSGDLYMFPADGGEPVKLNYSNKDLGYIRISPDGKQVVFDQLVRRNKEIWAIDNFLPKR